MSFQVKRCRAGGVALGVALGLGLAGCGDASPRGAGDRDDPNAASTTACPTYASAAPGEEVYDRFIVAFEPGSVPADDAGARAELLAEVGGRVCLDLTEVAPALPDAVVISTDRELGELGQAVLVAAFVKAGDVRYVEPDRVVQPDGGSDGGGTRQ